jgi:hypothetical protein
MTQVLNDVGCVTALAKPTFGNSITHQTAPDPVGWALSCLAQSGGNLQSASRCPPARFYAISIEQIFAPSYLDEFRQSDQANFF